MALKLTKRFVAGLVLCSALLIVATGITYIVTQVKAAHSLPMTLQITDSGATGFDLNQSIMTFGRLHPGAALSRYFDVDNTDESPVKVVAKARGSIAQYIVINPAVSIMTPDQEKLTIQVEARIPDDATPGNYTGTFYVYVMKP